MSICKRKFTAKLMAELIGKSSQSVKGGEEEKRRRRDGGGWGGTKKVADMK